MEQADLLRQVIDVLEDQHIVYLLVGSLASGVYGEPRLTADLLPKPSVVHLMGVR